MDTKTIMESCVMRCDGDEMTVIYDPEDPDCYVTMRGAVPEAGR